LALPGSLGQDFAAYTSNFINAEAAGSCLSSQVALWERQFDRAKSFGQQSDWFRMPHRKFLFF